ncbi:MAG: aspartyl/glutamyl-tRNA amidotransferase subunit C [Treponema sp.]|jgi:aspartyl-tRNA(Asn)/glutamyl-tRNA(Gln) amidotransferase subunit C|nr:aspartyl/glutamyl-tRNA amidotransferase subunit C [Treponema sp.]
MNIEDLQATAQLAHLNMGEEELAAAFPAFEQMLGFFAAMQSADHDAGAFPSGFAAAAAQGGSSGFVKGAAFFRPDRPNPNSNNSQNTGSTGSNDEALVSSLLHNAGDRDGRFIVVPNVL